MPTGKTYPNILKIFTDIFKDCKMSKISVLAKQNHNKYIPKTLFIFLQFPDMQQKRKSDDTD